MPEARNKQTTKNRFRTVAIKQVPLNEIQFLAGCGVWDKEEKLHPHAHTPPVAELDRAEI